MSASARPSWRTLLVLGLLALAAAVLVQHAGRGTIFFYDEWDFITRRRGLGADSFLTGHNGHLSALPVAVYKVLLQAFGLGTYWPYRLVLTLLHVLCGLLLFAVVRERTGDAAAVCAAALLLFLGSASDDLLWAFQIGFVGSMAAGLGMLLALDRRTTRGDVAAAVLLGTSLASSSLGVSFLVIAVVELGIRRDWGRLARVVVAPVGVYLLWRLGYGESDLRAGNLDDAPAYAFQMVSAAAGGLTGLGASAGPTLAILLLAGVAVSVVLVPPSPRLLAVLAGAASLWGLTALARAQLADPAATRYVYASVVLLLLAGAEMWPRGAVLRGRVLAVAGVVTAVAVLGNLLPLNQKAGSLRDNSEKVLAGVSALLLARDAAPPTYRPEPDAAPQIEAAKFLGAVDDFGSPGLSEAELARDREPDRVLADEVFSQLVPPVPTAAPAGARPRDCTDLQPGQDIDLPDAGALLFAVRRDAAPIELRLRRFASTPIPSALATVADGAPALVSTAPDAVQRPWNVVVTGAVRACPSR